MTTSTEEDDIAFGAAWRSERARRQEACLPAGEVTVSCSAPIGSGGLGRHLKEIVGALGRSGSNPRCLCGPGGEDVRGAELSVVDPGAPAIAAGKAPAALARMADLGLECRFRQRCGPPARGPDHLIAFSGQARKQFKRLGGGKAVSRSLVSPTSHLTDVDRRYREAVSRYPLERPWTSRLLGRSLRSTARPTGSSFRAATSGSPSSSRGSRRRGWRCSR